MESFGEKIRAARTNKGYKQSDVAAIIGGTASAVANWERDEVLPPFERLSRLCEVLEVSALDLLKKRYAFRDIVDIANKPAHERDYEEQVALNFSKDVLNMQVEMEQERLDNEQNELGYIANQTGLTLESAEALTGYATALFMGEDENKVSPVALEALNKLLSNSEGIRALENIAVYLRSGDFRFKDGLKVVTVDIGSFHGNGSVNKTIRFTPDMVGSIARSEFLRLIDCLKTHIPQEEINAAKTNDESNI